MGWGRGPFQPSCRDSSILAGVPSCLSCNLTVWTGSTFCSCYPLVTAEEERRRREITGLLATRGCKAGPTGGGRRVRPRASSCAELGDSRAGWPVRKVGPGWLAARPHNAPPPAPHPPPALLLSAAAASTDYPAAPAGSLHWSPSCSSSHPPPAACAALTQLQPRQSLPSVRMETYATHVVPFCSKIRLSVNTGSHAHCTRGQLLQLIGEILLRGRAQDSWQDS